MRRIPCALLLLFLGLLPCPAPAFAQVPFRFTPGKHSSGAELKVINEIPVLVVTGSPETIGTGIGVLALKPGVRVLDYPRDLLKVLAIDRAWGFFIESGKGMYKNFPPANKTELEAIVKAAGVSRDPVIAGNTFFDLKKVLACSAVLLEKDRSATGGPLLARNLDYPSLNYIQNYSLVTVYRQTGKKAFACIGFPGLVGVLSGMNESGLTVAVLEVFDIKEGEPHFDALGIPYGLCLRKVLEDCSTIEEARKTLEGMRRTTTINVVVADRKGVGVLEVSPRKVVLRRGIRGTCVCTNHFCDGPLKPASPLNIDRSFERFAKLDEVRDWKIKPGPEELRKQLDEVNLGNFTLQTMVFEPATLKLHLSIGKTPASSVPLRTLELAPLLNKTPLTKSPD